MPSYGLGDAEGAADALSDADGAADADADGATEAEADADADGLAGAEADADALPTPTARPRRWGWHSASPVRSPPLPSSKALRKIAENTTTTAITKTFE